MAAAAYQSNSSNLSSSIKQSNQYNSNKNLNSNNINNVTKQSVVSTSHQAKIIKSNNNTNTNNNNNTNINNNNQNKFSNSNNSNKSTNLSLNSSFLPNKKNLENIKSNWLGSSSENNTRLISKPLDLETEHNSNSHIQANENLKTINNNQYNKPVSVVSPFAKITNKEASLDPLISLIQSSDIKKIDEFNKNGNTTKTNQNSLIHDENTKSNIYKQSVNNNSATNQINSIDFSPQVLDSSILTLATTSSSINNEPSHLTKNEPSFFNNNNTNNNIQKNSGLDLLSSNCNSLMSSNLLDSLGHLWSSSFESNNLNENINLNVSTDGGLYCMNSNIGNTTGSGISSISSCSTSSSSSTNTTNPSLKYSNINNINNKFNGEKLGSVNSLSINNINSSLLANNNSGTTAKPIGYERHEKQIYNNTNNINSNSTTPNSILIQANNSINNDNTNSINNLNLNDFSCKHLKTLRIIYLYLLKFFFKLDFYNTNGNCNNLIPNETTNAKLLNKTLEPNNMQQPGSLNKKQPLESLQQCSGGEQSPLVHSHLNGKTKLLIDFSKTVVYLQDF
jgi:hypothetical protein